MTMVYRLVSEDKERSNRITNPPPSTVSIVLARRFGVKASKSWEKNTFNTLHMNKYQLHPNLIYREREWSTCSMHMPNVLPRILSESLYWQYVIPAVSRKSEKRSTFSGSRSPLCMSFLTCFTRLFLWLRDTVTK